MRAKLRASLEKPGDAVEYFDSVLRDKRYTNETVERYGLINALLRYRKDARADKELILLYESLQSGNTSEELENHHLGATIRIARKMLPSSPMIETLAARVKLATGQTAEALDIYQAALRIYPQHRALIYDYADALLRNNSADIALNCQPAIAVYPQRHSALPIKSTKLRSARGPDVAAPRPSGSLYAAGQFLSSHRTIADRVEK